MFHRCGCWWPSSHDVVVMRCGVVCLAATEAYVSDRALIQNTRQPLFLLVHTHTHTHTHTHLQWLLMVTCMATDINVTNSPCFTFHVCSSGLRERESSPASSSACEVEQPPCQRVKSVSAAPVQNPEDPEGSFSSDRRTGGTDTKHHRFQSWSI